MALTTVDSRKSKNMKIPRITLASIESLTMPVEIVLLADYRCAKCQKRVADIISRMNGETESVVVSLLEKKITLMHRVVKAPSRQIGAICKRPLSKFALACCMVMRINLDCNACCRKMRRILLNMKEIETHLIEKQQCRASVYGKFRPADVAIKIRKKMKRRVEILKIQEFDGINGHIEQQQPQSMDQGSSPQHI